MELNGVAGKTPDYAKAAQYFLRAANAGDDNAAYSYGVMLREGKGVRQDIGEAAHWLKRAADGGIIAGQVEYAIMLFNGDGIKKRRSRRRQDPSRRSRPRQSDRPEPYRPSLCQRPGAAARPRQGGGVEQLRQICGTPGPGPRRRHRRFDPRRAPTLHPDGPRSGRLLTPIVSPPLRDTSDMNVEAPPFLLPVFALEEGCSPCGRIEERYAHDDKAQCTHRRGDRTHR